MYCSAVISNAGAGAAPFVILRGQNRKAGINYLTATTRFAKPGSFWLFGQERKIKGHNLLLTPDFSTIN